MLAELDAARAAEQQYPQLVLAPLEREWSQIDAVEFQQVEGIEKCSAVMLPGCAGARIRDAHRVAHHGAPIGPHVGADDAAGGAHHARTERRHSNALVVAV